MSKPVLRLVTRCYSPSLPDNAVRREAPFPRFGFIAWDYTSPGGYGHDPIPLIAFGRADWADHVPPIVVTSESNALLAAEDY